MIVEGFEAYARMTGPWLQACNALNAMGISATRIAVGQVELAALTARFMNQRLAAFASFDGRVEPLLSRLDTLTEEYAENYGRQVRAIYSSWGDVLREDRPLTAAATLAGERDEERPAERPNLLKRENRREEKPGKRPEAPAH